jgi:hypothetical protein
MVMSPYGAPQRSPKAAMGRTSARITIVNVNHYSEKRADFQEGAWMNGPFAAAFSTAAGAKGA